VEGAPDSAVERLPPLYAAWMEALLGDSIPREALASCDHCAMRPVDGAGPKPGALYFDPAVKCCTFQPELHNFLAGRALCDGDPAAQAGRASVEKRIDGRVGVTPLGLLRSPVFLVLYNNSDESFGLSRSLRCPHYLEDGGRCGIWAHREATCATWFCKHVRGAVGRTFWIESLHKLLSAVERDLSRWCVLQLFSSDETLRRLAAMPSWTGGAEPVTGEVLDDKVSDKAFAALWGEWADREREFYTRCAALVEALSWDEAIGLCGTEAQSFARLTIDAYRQLRSTDVPSPLETGSFRLIQIQRNATRVSSYSQYDPIDIPPAVMELLPFFDGRPTADVLADIEAERGVCLEPALVRKLIDFKILVVPDR
jgi:hypothetical protein